MNTQQELAERLDAIRERLDNDDFLNNRGLGVNADRKLIHSG